ncbi:SNF2 family DNA or RNA helicase [Fontibacillus solani]|uniref:SNF2 family DNA or RNA helicase n=1 Tax=Fontibacillus solani TaxID=1572857 RepID=A0A7W3STQ3_9BACL|nr:DEAD/DEAH box helicase [Fontibacillus solani]MBA9085987.1 SNF2 family DNA or RNA helicase [Fontibacillus solani]
MLIIDYIENSHSAHLYMKEDSLAWGEVRRVCQEKGDINLFSDQSLSIPWWLFLTVRKSIRLVAVKYQLRLEFSTRAKELLVEANKKRSKFKQINLIDSVPEEEIKIKLTESGFKRELTAHQLRNVAKLASLPAAATFSVPGAGKTTEALAYYYLKKESDSLLFIVAPKNAFAAWDEQLSECKPNAAKIVRLTGGERAIEAILKKSPEKLIITYQQLPRVINLVSSYLSGKSVIMFLDESHRIKSGEEIVTGKAILSLSHLPTEKLIMSGTPMPNSPYDLVAQFNFLYPEIEVDEESVMETIRSIYVRTTKAELGLMEPKYKIVSIPMSVSQKKLYDLLRSEEARQFENLRANQRNMLRSMGRSVIRMLQLTSNPSLILKNIKGYDDIISEIITEERSPKIEYVCNRVRQLAKEGKKSIVWSTFVENIELLKLRLDDLGADYIHGGVDAGSEDDDFTREGKIKRFHDDPNAMVLIANPAAASEGISLHMVCHNAIYLDRNYNAAQFLQSVDRIHRLGLPKDIETEVEILICPHSVDESVERRLKIKIDRMSEVLRDDSIRVEPEYVNAESFEESLSIEDINDFVRHLKES